jgi:hypothetical protein
MYLSNDYLVFDFPYDAAKVAAIKVINGAKWDKLVSLLLTMASKLLMN